MKKAMFVLAFVSCLYSVQAPAAAQPPAERSSRTTVAPAGSPDSGAWSWVAEAIEKILEHIPV